MPTDANLTAEATADAFRGLLNRAFALSGQSARSFAPRVGVSRTALNRYLDGQRSTPFYVLVNAIVAVGGIVEFSAKMPDSTETYDARNFRVIEGGKS